jgi:hypothetical protein
VAVLDIQAKRDEAALLKGLLKRRGLPADFGLAIGMLGATIRDHAHFQTLLTGISGEERQQLYDAVRPSLKFKAKPLDQYVSAAASRAEREQWPTQDKEGKLHAFKPARDADTAKRDVEDAIAAGIAERTLTVQCADCERTQAFFQVGLETHVDVVLKARRAGWVYDYKAFEPVEICPECWAKREA